MRIVWTDESLVEIEGIIDYIAADNEKAAIAMANRIFEAVETVLPDNPKSGRPGRVKGTRELIVHSSYVVAYHTANAIEILSVRHSALL